MPDPSWRDHVLAEHGAEATEHLDSLGPDDTEMGDFPYCAFCYVTLADHPDPLCSPGVVRDLRAEVERLTEERDAARLVSEGRTMEQYDQQAAIERVRAEARHMGGSANTAYAKASRLIFAALDQPIEETPDA